MLDKLSSHLPPTAGADFVPILSQMLTFDSTVTSIALTLNITADQVVEDTESLSASLMLEDSSQGSVIQLDPASTAITITDNNSEHYASFKTNFTCSIYLNVKTLYATLSIDYFRKLY